MNLLSEKDEKLRKQGEKHIWNFLAKRQKPLFDQLDKKLKESSRPTSTRMSGMKCHCGKADLWLVITRSTMAEIKNCEADYILARELHTYTSAAETYCPICKDRQPCDISYQVDK